MRGNNWTIAEAKSKISEIIEKAKTEGPQTITRHGRITAVIVDPEEWERKSERVGNLSEFLAASPLKGSGIEMRRSKTRVRKIVL